MTKFEKSFYILLFVLFGAALGFNIVEKDYSEGVWVMIAITWMYNSYNLANKLMK